MAYQVHDGYQRFSDNEPLILEPEDWSFSEWATICMLCGLPLGQTERIVLHVNEMECFVDLSKKVPDSGRTYTVTEVCPHCESEVKMRWDTDTMGFKAFCPVCGKRLMLCDACRHAESIGPCDYDSQTDICRWNKDSKYPELSMYCSKDHHLDLTRDDPDPDGSDYEVVFETEDERYYCFLHGTTSILEALGLFFKNHPHITYDMIEDHIEV